MSILSLVIFAFPVGTPALLGPDDSENLLCSLVDSGLIALLATPAGEAAKTIIKRSSANGHRAATHVAHAHATINDQTRTKTTTDGDKKARSRSCNTVNLQDAPIARAPRAGPNPGTRRAVSLAFNPIKPRPC